MPKILVIDDKQDNLISVKALLQNMIPDCRVFTAQSGKEGLAIAAKEQPDTILLDIIMPEMDGYQVCEELKKKESTKYIPVIMLTAIKTDTESRIKGLEVGADAFFTKPIEPIELSAQINVMLRIKKAEDKLRAEKVNLEDIIKARTRDLQESDRLLQAIFNDPDTFICILEPDGTFRRANESALQIIDFANSDLVGTKFWETPWWSRSEELQRKLQTEIRKAGRGVVRRLEAECFDRNGNNIFVSCSIRPVRDTEGRIYQIIVECTNITERRKIEEELQRKNEELQIFNDIAIDRELLINELRKEVNDLLQQLGKAAKYEIVR